MFGLRAGNLPLLPRVSALSRKGDSHGLACTDRFFLMMTPAEPPRGGYNSPPCFAGDVAPDYFDPLAVDPQQALDVARWRKAERARLLAARHAMSVRERQHASAAIMHHLRQLIAARPEMLQGRVLSAYWPIKAEPNLRDLLFELHHHGVIITLPVVAQKAAPLVFRRWTPETRMIRGDWNIPVPPATAAQLSPDIALAPLVGWAPGGWRLGYGGGYFDRSLAARQPRPFAIGIGFQSARLHTIFPQPHDIALDLIVTEAGLQGAADT